MQKLITSLVRKNSSKIILVVLDGLGGLPVNGRTELETARTPNMDQLARISACGLHTPVASGITPGSGPGHLSLFGYDPLEYRIGRGILEALGLGLEIRTTDIAVRCNFATMRDGLITDRRAGRIPTEQSRKLTELLQKSIPRIEDVEITFAPGMEHRLALLMRFPHPLDRDAADIPDTDPQLEGRQPLKPQARSKSGERIAAVADTLIAKAQEVLRHEEKANFLLMRGFSGKPDIPTFSEAYGLNALAVATYPMYRGLAKLVGMTAPDLEGTVEDEIAFLKSRYEAYDFFFLHVKKVDSYGEDGNFPEKVKRIEEFDALLPRIQAMNPDVLVITGDHSTPALVRGHSWHPVPVLLHSPYVLGGLCTSFSERECVKGEFSIFPTVELMSYMLANSLRLGKFGA
jgi:2,3-bisphosphoglycerate-independent phosphoglycerate mutase